MRLLFEKLKDKYTYILEIESIIYNRQNLDEEIVKSTAENFANSVIDELYKNSKFIKDSLSIDEFDVEYVDFSSPTIMMNFTTDSIIEDSQLKSILGRYASKEYKEKFDSEEGITEIVFKPIRGELKVYLSR